MERETGIEPAPSAWKAEVLPLNYSRPARNSSTGPYRRHEARRCDPVFQPCHWLPLAVNWWREVDSNHRRRKPADLQSAPVGRLGIPPTKNGYCVDRGLVCQHLDDAETAGFSRFSDVARDGRSVVSRTTRIDQLLHALGKLQQMQRLLPAADARCRRAAPTMAPAWACHRAYPAQRNTITQLVARRSSPVRKSRASTSTAICMLDVPV